MLFAKQQQTRLILLDINARRAANRLPGQFFRCKCRLNRLLDGIRARALAAANAEIRNPRHEMQRVCKRLCVCAESNREPAFRVFF